MTNAHPVMTALARHVPLTLLADLYDEAGPDSRAIHARELGDLSWLRDLAYPTPPAQDAPQSAPAAG